MADLAGLGLALFAQLRLDRYPDAPVDGLLLYIVAALLWLPLAASHTSDEPPARLRVEPGPPMDRRRRARLLAGVGLVASTGLLWPLLTGSAGGGLGILAYPAGGDAGANHLTAPGLILWLTGLGLITLALADPVRWPPPRLPDPHARLELAISPRLPALAAILACAALFRLWDLPDLPLEMTSDHTEKLKDIQSVLDGLRPAFFHHNAGREPLQFYWTALLVRLGMPLDFLTMKLGMAAVSVATVPIVYLAARRLTDRTTALLAALVMALAPWHIQITRIGLRIALSPLFVALSLFLLVRALETGRRNHWLAAGAVSALGVYGYTGYRPMVLVLASALVIRLVYARREGWAEASAGLRTLVGHLAAAAAVGAVVLIPILRYAIDRPDYFFHRSLTRMTDAEQALGRPFMEQLATNYRDVLLLANYTSDSAWFQSPAGRSALETVGGALLVLGIVLAMARAFRGDWRAAVLLAAWPLLLASSALAVAFPIENPSLSRAAGGIPVAVILAALPVAVLTAALHQGGRSGAALLLACALFVFMGSNTAARYFVEYRHQYDHSTHNTTELAAAIRAFVDLGGDLEHAYLVGWAHGPDYRAIGQLAGDLDWNGLLWGVDPSGADALEQIQLQGHPEDPAPKLYLVGAASLGEAELRVQRILEIYPTAMAARHEPRVAERGPYWTVLVPGRQGRISP